jgi:rod shape-determining protein MreD
MYIKIFQNVKRFIFLLLLQVMILNHVQWSGYINPYVYILFIMMLPIETPRWLVLLLGLITGLIIDMFGNTGGMHAAATVLMAFLRPGVLRIVSPRDDYDSETSLTPQKMGLKWFLTYSVIMILIHHLTFFYVEVFRFSEFFITFFKALLNSAITLLIIIMGMYLFGKAQANERIVR